MVAAPKEKTDSGTQEKILDAAEALFIELGFSATSLRAIAAAANVNLAATNYHFGSKFGLLAAVFHRCIQPIDEARLAGLEALESANRPPDARQIVEAFLRPIIDLQTDPQLSARLPRLAGRIMGEPESLTKPLLEAEFAEVAGRYQSALAQAMPAVSPAEIAWRFHFMVGAMVHLMRLQAPLGQVSSAETLHAGITELIEFVVAGMCQVEKSESSA